MRISRRQALTRWLALSLGGLLCLAGCSAGYTSERYFWHAERLSAPIVKDPTQATPAQFAVAIAAYQVVITKTPGTLWAPRAHLATGSLYALQQRYDEARAAYGQVLQNYNQYAEFCLNARAAIAKTHEAQEQWDEAIRVYEQIGDFYPWSSLGLEVPLYIATTYERRKQREQAAKAYGRAVRIYQRRILDAPDPDSVVRVKGLLSLTYQRLAHWEDALQMLRDLASTPTGVNRPLVLLTMASIYHNRLHELSEAEAVYRKLANEYPEHPFGKAARSQLERLGASLLEEMPATVTTAPEAISSAPPAAVTTTPAGAAVPEPAATP